MIEHDNTKALKQFWFNKDVTLYDINERSRGTLSEYLNIEYTDIRHDALVAEMEVTTRHHQPMGIMHGGASCVLAESVGSCAANLCVDHTKQYCVGLQIDTNHLKSVKECMLTAVATPNHIGHSTHVWNIDISDKNQLISVTKLTMAVLKIGVSLAIS